MRQGKNRLCAIICKLPSMRGSSLAWLGPPSSRNGISTPPRWWRDQVGFERVNILHKLGLFDTASESGYETPREHDFLARRFGGGAAPWSRGIVSLETTRTPFDRWQ